MGMWGWDGGVGARGCEGGNIYQRKLGGEFRVVKMMNWRTGIQLMVNGVWVLVSRPWKGRGGDLLHCGRR
jgi:hypothetical protein